MNILLKSLVDDVLQLFSPIGDPVVITVQVLGAQKYDGWNVRVQNFLIDYCYFLLS